MDAFYDKELSSCHEREILSREVSNSSSNCKETGRMQVQVKKDNVGSN